MIEIAMTTRTRDAYRRKLEALITLHQRENTGLREEALRPVGVDTQGARVQEADLGQQAAEEDLALTLLGGETHILAEATAALQRLERGTFGTCETCGQPLPRARLETIPYARHCVRCAQAAEATGRT